MSIFQRTELPDSDKGPTLSVAKKADPGLYSFKKARSKDFKSIDHTQNRALDMYRSNVDKVLTQV